MQAKTTPMSDASKSRKLSQRPKQHEHRCPLCEKITIETDEVCGMWIDHVFACVPCLETYLLCLELEMDVTLG